MTRHDRVRLLAMILIGTGVLLGCAGAASQPASPPVGTAMPSASPSNAVGVTITTGEEAATFALAVLAGEHWDSAYVRDFRAIDPVVVDVERRIDGNDVVWDIRVTGRFEILTCPVRKSPIPGTDICDIGDQAIVNVRIGDRFATVLSISRELGFEMQMPVNWFTLGPLPTATATAEPTADMTPEDDCAPIQVSSEDLPPRGIYRMRADGSDLCLLTSGGVREDNPVWSPDGQYIAFVRAIDPYGINFEVVVINADGSGERNIANSPGNDSAPAWLPGYPHLLTFISERDTGQGVNAGNVYRVDPSAEELVVLPVTRGEGLGLDLEWSPDGRRFAYSNGNIAIHDLSSGETDTLVSRDVIPELVGAIWPSWSPDGQRIAFEVDRGLSATRQHEIYTINIDGTAPLNLTNHDAEDNAPAWSPDGTRIVFASNRDGDRDIYIMNADGSNVTQTTNLFGDEMDPAWSPDGQYIVLTTAREWP